MGDLVTMAVLSALCVVLYKFGNWCGAKVPVDDTYDFRGYRKKPFTREDLDELHRRCIGKPQKEQQWIIRNYRGTS